MNQHRSEMLHYCNIKIIENRAIGLFHRGAIQSDIIDENRTFAAGLRSVAFTKADANGIYTGKIHAFIR
jgi:hypothetical protein